MPTIPLPVASAFARAYQAWGDIEITDAFIMSEMSRCPPWPDAHRKLNDVNTDATIAFCRALDELAGSLELPRRPNWEAWDFIAYAREIKRRGWVTA